MSVLSVGGGSSAVQAVVFLMCTCFVTLKCTETSCVVETKYCGDGGVIVAKAGLLLLCTVVN